METYTQSLAETPWTTGPRPTSPVMGHVDVMGLLTECTEEKHHQNPNYATFFTTVMVTEDKD